MGNPNYSTIFSLEFDYRKGLETLYIVPEKGGRIRFFVKGRENERLEELEPTNVPTDWSGVMVAQLKRLSETEARQLLDEDGLANLLQEA